ENDVEALLAGVVDDRLEDVQRVQVIEVAVGLHGVVDGGQQVGAGERQIGSAGDGHAAALVADGAQSAHDGIALHHLVGEGDAQGVEAKGFDAVDDGLVRPVVQAGGDEVVGVEAVPVDRLQADRRAAGVDDGRPGGVEVRRGAVGRGGSDRGGGEHGGGRGGREAGRGLR